MNDEDFKVPTLTEHIGNYLQVNLSGTSKHAPTFEVFEDEGKQWRWRERASNGQIASTAGEHYFQKSNAKRAAYAHARKVKGSSVKVV